MVALFYVNQLNILNWLENWQDLNILKMKWKSEKNVIIYIFYFS